MPNLRILASTTILISSVLFTPEPAHAEPPGSEATRLIASRATEDYELVVPGTDVRAGGAMVAVNAPLSVTRAIVTDYGHYAEFLPQFDKSRIVAKSSAGTDVYLSLPILHGAAKLWAVARFTGPSPDGSGEKVEGRRQSDGNVEEMHTVFRLYAPDPAHTILKLEILLIPKLPIPARLLSGELRSAAERAVRAVSERAEARSRAAVEP